MVSTFDSGIPRFVMLIILVPVTPRATAVHRIQNEADCSESGNPLPTATQILRSESDQGQSDLELRDRAMWAGSFLSAFVLVVLLELVRCETGQKTVLSRVNWMHIPKTSSWLGDFLFMYACPHMAADFEAYGNQEFMYEELKNNVESVAKCATKITLGRDGGFGWHDPFIPELTNGSSVALFRKPRNRLVSAFLFEKGMMIPPGHLHSQNETLQEEIFKYISNTTFPIMTYANYIGIRSCQTKMVLGHNCGTEFPISDALLAEAKRRVEFDFAFVGLTEEAAASAKLFYAMHGAGRPEPKAQPHAKIYRANKNHSKLTRTKLLEVLREQKWSDPPEQALYQHVRRLFYTRCAHYNIPTLEQFDFSAPDSHPTAKHMRLRRRL